MPETKCPFCGSDKIVLETPFVALDDRGDYSTQKTFCCKSQEQNQNYVKRRYDPSMGEVPDPEEVSKW